MSCTLGYRCKGQMSVDIDGEKCSIQTGDEVRESNAEDDESYIQERMSAPTAIESLNLSKHSVVLSPSQQRTQVEYCSYRSPVLDAGKRSTSPDSPA